MDLNCNDNPPLGINMDAVSMSACARGMDITERIFTNVDQAPAEVLDYCSRLYNAHRYTHPNGETNPYDPRYYGGGVHFNRSSEWFAEHLKMEGARLLVFYANDDRAIGFSLFFLNPDSFPAFAGSSLPFNQSPALRGRVGYTYFIMIDPQLRRNGLAAR